MNTSFQGRRRLPFETLESRVMPAATALAALSNTDGLPANPGSIQVQAGNAPTVSSRAVSGGSRAAAAVLVTLNGSLNANVSPGINVGGLTGTPSSIASTAAIEVQAILDSPSSFIN
ncbi:MAG: hypothetical protein ABSG53_15585, partial [Thermoguttaceae bacterium]